MGTHWDAIVHHRSTAMVNAVNSQASADCSVTVREREIICLIADGKSNKDIAEVLQLSVFTVRTHRQNLMKKFKLHNSADIAMYAINQGFHNAQ